MNPIACDFEPTATIHIGCVDLARALDAQTPTPATTIPMPQCLDGARTRGTLPEACNYDANANVSDGTCEFDTCVGCAVEHACNYDPGATIAGFCDFLLPILIAKATVCWKIAARLWFGDAQTNVRATTTPQPTWKMGLATTIHASVAYTLPPPTTMRQPLTTTVRACSCSARNCHVWTRSALPISMATERCKSKT